MQTQCASTSSRSTPASTASNLLGRAFVNARLLNTDVETSIFEGLSIEDGYNAQDMILEDDSLPLGKHIGWKIGATNDAAQKRLM